MNSRNTWRLFLAAVGLFAFIFFFERTQPDPAQVRNSGFKIFGRLDPAAVGVVEVRFTNQVIRAERTNGTWRLTTPLYPAQNTPIETFLSSLAALTARESISARDVQAQPRGLKDFGLDPPPVSLSFQQGSNRFHLHFGSRTPLVDQVYAQVPGSGDVLVTDAAILKSIPADVNEWRSPMLIQLGGLVFDRVVIRSGQRALELERNAANQAWRIAKPIQARADGARIAQLLQQLQTARVNRFVTDSAVVDLERFGLQTPELEVFFSLDTNRLTGLEFGGSPTNDPGSVYVRRTSHTNIVLAPKELLENLRQPYKVFHDPRLVSTSPAELSQISVRSATPFTVARQTNGLWQITAPVSLPADSALMGLFITNLTRLEIVDFAKDVPTDADLKQFGLAPASFSVSLFSSGTNAVGGATNHLSTQLDFGVNQLDTVAVRRTDEIPIYMTPFADSLDLPRQAWQVRDRRVFDFQSTNAAALVVIARGQTNRITRQSVQSWVADPIQNAAIDEAVLRLGQLRALGWVGRGAQRFASFGLEPADSQTIVVELLRDGESSTAAVIFGKRTIRGNVYAAAVLTGDPEPLIFEFPGALHQDLQRALGLAAQP